MFVECIVMSTTFSVTGFVYNQTLLVNCQLSFDCMFFLLSAVVCFTFAFVFGSWNLLFCCIYEGFKAGEEFFNLCYGGQSLDFLVLFSWGGQDFLDQCSSFLMLFRMLVWLMSQRYPSRVEEVYRWQQSSRISSRLVRFCLKGCPAPIFRLRLFRCRRFCSQAGYFWVICWFRVLNSSIFSPVKFLKCSGFLDNVA